MAKSTLIMDDELFARAIDRLRGDASRRGAPTQIPSDREPTQILSDQEPTQIPSDQEIERALSQLRQPPASVVQPKDRADDLAAEPTIDTGFDQQDISSLKTADDAPARGNGKNSDNQGSGRSKWTAARWTVAGFVVGIAFWHVVGFWDFISTVVLDHEHLAANKAASQLRPSVPPKSAPANSVPAVSLAAAKHKPAKSINPATPATQITTGSLPRQTSRPTGVSPNPGRAAQLKRVLAGAPLLREPCLTLAKEPLGGQAVVKPCVANSAAATALTLRPTSARVDRLDRPKSKVRLERLDRQVRLNRQIRPKPKEHRQVRVKPKVRPELLDDRIKQRPTLPAKETAPSPWSIVVDKKR